MTTATRTITRDFEAGAIAADRRMTLSPERPAPVGFGLPVEFGDAVAQNLVHATPPIAEARPRRWRDPRPGCGPLVDARLDLQHPRDEIRLSLDLDRTRARNVDIVDRRDAAGPRGHHDDAVGEEDRLRYRMRDEGDRLARLHPDFLDQQIHFVAREGVERAERLVHQQHRGIDREASARSRRAAACRRRARAAYLFSKPFEIDALQQPGDALQIGRGDL